MLEDEALEAELARVRDELGPLIVLRSTRLLTAEEEERYSELVAQELRLLIQRLEGGSTPVGA